MDTIKACSNYCCGLFIYYRNRLTVNCEIKAGKKFTFAVWDSFL